MLARNGMFGKIEVIDSDDDKRFLLLNGQIQGAGFLQPDGTAVSPFMKNAGPLVPASSYMYGWLLAGAMHPSASAVMVGLGSGMGAIGLLHNSSMDLTVIEIDQVMVDVARQSFPLLQHYEMEGRLNIVTADAKDYLEQSDTFDVGFADAYDGQSYNIKNSYVPLLLEKSRHFYANVIDPIDGASTRLLLRLAQTVQKPIQYRIHTSCEQSIDSTQYQPANWLMTTDMLNPLLLDQLYPFNELPDCVAKDYATTAYTHLLNQIA